MTTPALNARLTVLFDAHKQSLHLINRLAKLPSQPGTESLNPESTEARLELGADIHQSLKEQEQDFELLRQEIEDQTSASLTTAARRKDSERERETTDLLARVSRLGENLSTSASRPPQFEPCDLTLTYRCSARSQFRKAQLQAKRNAEAAKRKERELLFTGLQHGNSTESHSRRRGHENISKEDQVVNAASDVTAGLTQLYASMSQELSKSQFAQETLGEVIETLIHSLRLTGLCTG